MAGYTGPAPMDLSAVKEKKITQEECKRQRKNGLCIYCGESRDFAGNCLWKLKVALAQVEINPFNESEDKRKGKEAEPESEKV